MIAVLAAATLVLAAVSATSRRWHPHTKAAASLGFIATAIAAGAFDTAYGRWVLVALGLSLIGDVALLSKEGFLLGLGAFLIAHLAYVVAMTTQRLAVEGGVVAAVVMGGVLVSVLRWLLPHVPARLTVPIVGYVLAITAMVIAAASAAAGYGPTIVLPAAALFTASDVLVARDRFVSPGAENRRIGLPMYYAAQVLFALSVA